jgi:hypothetical protein
MTRSGKGRDALEVFYYDLLRFNILCFCFNGVFSFSCSSSPSNIFPEGYEEGFLVFFRLLLYVFLSILCGLSVISSGWKDYSNTFWLGISFRGKLNSGPIFAAAANSLAPVYF